MARLPLVRTLSADRGDADVTLTPGSDVETTQMFATTLTDDRAVTLGTGYVGAWFRVVRTAAGAFALDVGGLKTLLQDGWCDVEHDGSAWALTAYGELSHLTASPAQITSNQNDYGTLPGDTLRLSSDAGRNITGLAGGSDGRSLRIVNVGAQNIVLQNQHTDSAEANRIITGTGADITIAADDVVTLWYDGTTARWRVTSHY